MQKNKHIASILLWSIFISMILSILFLSISTKITKNLKNNDDLISNTKIEEIIKNQILNYHFKTKKINKNLYLVFESLDPFRRTIKQNETFETNFFSGNAINIKIDKIYGADLYYESYQGTDITNINTLIGTGIISDSEKELSLLNSSNNWGKIIFKNLGGESKIKIYSNKTIIPKYINYYIIKIIGNKHLIKEKNIKKIW